MAVVLPETHVVANAIEEPVYLALGVMEPPRACPAV
jgi:hypothetical protein